MYSLYMCIIFVYLYKYIYEITLISRISSETVFETAFLYLRLIQHTNFFVAN